MMSIDELIPLVLNSLVTIAVWELIKIAVFKPLSGIVNKHINSNNATTVADIIVLLTLFGLIIFSYYCAVQVKS